MTKIDISEWKPFAIGNIFDVIKGTRLTKAHMKSGDIRFIGSSSMNNGCTRKIRLPFAIMVVLEKRFIKMSRFLLRTMSTCYIRNLI